MKVFETFKVYNNRYFMFVSENEKSEVNFFDEITVYYYINNIKTILFQDFLGEGIKSFYNITSKVLMNKLDVPESYLLKGVGYEWNLVNNYIANELDNDIEDVTAPYLMWSTPSKYANETWMYNNNNNIYLEVSKDYKWHYSAPKETDNFITFDEFKRIYHPYDIVELDVNLVKEWNRKCVEIIDKMQV